MKQLELGRKPATQLALELGVARNRLSDEAGTIAAVATGRLPADTIPSAR